MLHNLSDILKYINISFSICQLCLLYRTNMLRIKFSVNFQSVRIVISKKHLHYASAFLCLQHNSATNHDSFAITQIKAANIPINYEEIAISKSIVIHTYGVMRYNTATPC